jgi:hypothetical protein
MLRITRVLLVACLAVSPAMAAAQRRHAAESAERCTVCAPRLSVDAAALWRAQNQLPSAGSDRTALLLRAEFTAMVGGGIPSVGLFSTMEFVPADGPSPTITGGLMLSPLPASSRFSLTGGLGFIDARQGIGESTPGAYVLRGWGQVGVHYRTPVHDLALYAQAGAPFSGGRHVSYQVGLSHPLAPYTLHAGL